MAKVFVYNENKYPLSELFKGEKVSIEGRDYWRDKNGQKKVMDIYEANEFRGAYHPIPIDGNGKLVDDPKYYKMVKLEPIPDDVEPTQVSTYKCMAQNCQHVSPSSEELEAHIKVRHPSEETLILPEEDARISRKKKKEVN